MAEIDLEALAKRCEALEGPCRETDLAIVGAIMAGMRHPWFIAPPAFTASLDAAMMLVPEGYACSLGDEPVAWWAHVGPKNSATSQEPAYTGSTPALALCCAALRASLMEGEGEK